MTPERLWRIWQWWTKPRISNAWVAFYLLVTLVLFGLTFLPGMPS